MATVIHNLTPIVSGMKFVGDSSIGTNVNPYPSTLTQSDLVTLASQSIPGQIIWVVNPCVPLGVSRLQCNSTKTNYVPPPGESIVSKWSTTLNTPLVSVTTGGTSLVVGYQSPIIPDYMLPANALIAVTAYSMCSNAGAGVAGAFTYHGLCGATPGIVTANSYNVPFGANGTPSAGGFGTSSNTIAHILVMATRGGFNHPAGGSGKLDRNSMGAWVSGANRAYWMIIPTKVDDLFWFYGHEYTMVNVAQ
jgi:hypothetical protein